MVVANANSKTISVFRNISTGAGTISYAPKVDLTPGSRSVSIGDLDCDGKADLVVVNTISNTVLVFRNTSTISGTISYAAKVDFTTGLTPVSVSTADLDGDGKADLVVTNVNSNTVSVFRNTSTGAGTISYAPKVDFTTGSGPFSFSIGDLDGDGRADLVVANASGKSVSVFRNTSMEAGTISFAPKVDFVTGESPLSVSVGDLNGDGKADLAVANFSSNTVSILMNNSTGAGIISYAAKVDFTTGLAPLSVSIGDLDGDGKADLAVANSGSDSVSVFRNSITPKEILAFSIPQQTISATINATNHTVNIEVVFGTDVTALVSTFTLSTGAIAKVGNTTQVSGTTVNDFTNPVTYIIVGEDGATTLDWTVTVTTAPNTETDITAFSLTEQTEPATINATNHTVDIEVVFGTNVTAMVSTFTLSTGATAKVGTTAQVSGTTANDFTSPVTYSITAEDGTTAKDWIVTITVAPNSETNILSFSIPNQVGSTSIDNSSHSINLDFFADADFTSFVAIFTLSEGATAQVGVVNQVSGTTANDFTSPVTYIITAEDGTTTADWTITVNPIGVTSITVDQLNGKVRIYPNPTNNKLTIDLDESFGLTSELYLLDLSGKIILQKLIRSGDELDLSGIRQGVYILLLKSDKQVFRTKIEKR